MIAATEYSEDPCPSCPLLLLPSSPARHREGARPTPSCLAGAVAGGRGWVRSTRHVWRYTGGHARVASDLSVTLSVLGGGVGRARGARASGGASMLTATAWSSGKCFGPPRFPGAILPPSSSKGWTQRRSAHVLHAGIPAPGRISGHHRCTRRWNQTRRVPLRAPRASARHAIRCPRVSPTRQDQQGDREDSWPAYPAESHVQGAATDQPKRRSRTLRDWLLLAFFVASSSYLVCRPS